jgi:(p)ppGpp synthase/HD superfamily hydrolase
MERFEKLRVSLRYYLQGAADQDPRYLNPLRAFEFAMKKHTGKRKDGITPEFMHQLETTLFIRTIRGALLHPAESMSVMLLHDVPEDCNVSFEEIDERFGATVGHGVRRMTKLYRGVKKPDSVYFSEMLDCPIATICKGSDRINNQNTMQGVFSREKQLSYMEETANWILPMLKNARRQYPEQENGYEVLKFVLRSQLKMLGVANGVTVAL